MWEAIAIWRLFPRQIRSGLSLYHHRSIGEWHRGEMSSAELLELLDELPETSKFKEASERTLRVLEYDGQLVLTPALGDPPEDAVVVAEFVDWTHDRKILARNTKEIVALRVDMRLPQHAYTPDFTGLQEPIEAILAARKRAAQAALKTQGQSQIHAGLYGFESG